MKVTTKVGHAEIPELIIITFIFFVEWRVNPQAMHGLLLCRSEDSPSTKVLVAAQVEREILFSGYAQMLFMWHVKLILVV